MPADEILLQVFALLMLEMIIFGALIVPLPFTWRRKLFTFISESPLIAKLQYGMKVRHPALKTCLLSELIHGQITFIFILILFLDSVSRVYRVQAELQAVKDRGQP